MASGETRVERLSDTVLQVRRSFAAPVDRVFAAWTQPELMRRWWVPPSFPVTLVGIEMDARTGGSYCLTFAHPDAPEPMAFHGRYIEVVPDARLVWTNEESDDGAVTTVTFEAEGDVTIVTLEERCPTREALDAAMEGSAAGLPMQFDALAELLAE